MIIAVSECLMGSREFKSGIIPLIAPLKLTGYLIKKYEVDYLENQVFLNPCPEAVGLRSQINAFR